MFSSWETVFVHSSALFAHGMCFFSHCYVLLVYLKLDSTCAPITKGYVLFCCGIMIARLTCVVISILAVESESRQITCWLQRNENCVAIVASFITCLWYYVWVVYLVRH